VHAAVHEVTETRPDPPYEANEASGDRRGRESGRMLSWSPQGWVRSRKCDAPGCQNESLAAHRLVTRPVVGPALDIPLCLYYCDEHKDVESLLDRYLELAGAGR
jgi:hypothetical protein